MKKIITFLFCTTVFASAFAQPNRRDYDRDDDGDNNPVYQHNDFNIVQRNMEIQRISNRYDYRIEQVSCDRSLSHREKKFAIRALRVEKAEQINNIYLRYSNSDVYDDWHSRDNYHGHRNHYDD